MNEKLQYASMLEIPVNTCNVTLKTGKKKKFGRKKVKNPEAVKEELMNKINSEPMVEETLEQELPKQEMQAISGVEFDKEQEQSYATTVNEDSRDSSDSVEEDLSMQTVEITKKQKKRFKFSVITAQFAIIGVLLATIFLTNAFYSDSGINVFFKNVFGNGQTQVAKDLRTHQEFAPVLAVGQTGEVSLDSGVMTFSGEGSVYSPCDGKITSVTRDGNGKYIFEITHSENFKSVISGLDYAYAGLDDTVYSNIPVGYVNSDGATMCFKGGDDLVISDYQIVNGSVVWAV